MTTQIRIVHDDLSGAATQALIQLHFQAMHEHSPAGTAFVLDLTDLRSADVTVWSGWACARIAGIGALKDLGGGSGEVKSMRTHPDFLRQGVAKQLLEHIIRTARGRGMSRLSLETGTGPAFEPALALYRQRGFLDGPAFANYPSGTGFNQFLHLDLRESESCEEYRPC